jgi:rhodanese-related sulfurtransferase
MNVTPQEVKAMQERGESFRLIDVREQDEWNTVRIDGAELIPLSQFQQRATGELDPADKIVLYCHHGMRSARAQGFLQAHGYGDVLNLTGGIDALLKRRGVVADPSGHSCQILHGAAYRPAQP